MKKDTTQSKRKIIITLLSTALFLVIMGGIVAVGWMKKNTTSDEVVQTVLSPKMEISSIDDLEAALEAEDTIKITLSKDVVIRESLIVRGNKTLCGDYSIAMALDAEADQNILHVKSGAELVLDGATIDGNHVASGILVESGADFTLSSGQIVYAQAWGVKIEGTAAIKGGTITETAHSGVVVGAGGKVEMTGGELVKNGQNAAYIVPDGYMKICDNAVVRDSDGMLLTVSGECDVIGVPLTGAGTYLANVAEGKLNITQAEGVSEKLECSNAGMRAFQVGKDGQLNAKNLHVHDVGLIAINLSVGAISFDMEDSIVQGVKEYGIIYRGSLREESHLTNVEIKDVEKYMGIQNALDTTVIMENITISNVGDRGIANSGGIIKGKNIVVKDSKSWGVTSSKTDKADGEVEIDGLEIDGIGSRNAINSNGSTVKVSNVKISNVKGHGIRVHGNGKIVVNNAVIRNPEMYGMAAEEGSINFKNVKIYNAGARGAASVGGTITGTDLTVDTTKKEHGITSSKKGKVTITGLTLKNIGTESKAANGFNVVTESVMNITDVTVSNVKGIGARCDHATLNMKNVQISDVGDRGVMNMAGAINAEKLVVTNAKTYGVTSSAVENVPGTLTIKDVTINKVGTNNGINCAGSVLDAKDITISDVKLHGLRIHKAGKAVVENITITDIEGVGVYTEGKNDIKITNIKIKDAGTRGVNSQDGVTTIKNMEIENTKQHGIACSVSAKLNITELSMKNAKGNGINAVENAQVTIDNGSMDNVGGYGARTARGAKVTLNNVDMNQCGAYGVVAEPDTAMVLKDVDINKPKARGVATVGGTITGKNVTITAPETEHGITGSANGVVNLSNVTITDVLAETANGFNVVDGAKVTINGGSITNVANYGARAARGEATVTLIDVDVKNVGETGALAEAGGKVALTNVEITGAKRGVQAEEPTLVSTLKNVTLKEIKTYGIESKGGNVVTDGVTVEEGVQYGVLAHATGKIELNNATIDKPNYRGVVAGFDGTSGTITGDTVVVTKPQKDHAITGSGSAEITLANVTISDVLTTGKNGINSTGSAVVTINGGSITNTNTYGARSASGATVVLNGVDITNAGDTGVFVEATAKAELGDVVITGGKKGVYVAEPTLATTLTNVTITGVKTYGIESKGGNIVTNGLTVKNGAMYGVLAYTAGRIELNNATIENPNNRGVVAGYDGTSGTITGNGVTIKTVTKDHALTAGNSSVITLSNVAISDVVPSDEKEAGKNGINATGSSQVTINGGSITNAKQYGARAASGATLTLNGVGITKSGTNALFVESTATLNLQGDSVIDGENAAIRAVDVAGTFNMEGGTIKNFTMTSSAGAAVYLQGTGTFVMKNGTIENCTAKGGGAAIYSKAAGSTADMQGGTIKNCTVTGGNGGAVYVLAGTSFTMSGGTIDGCTASGVGGGIHGETNGTIKVSGGTIKNCSATSGGGIRIITGEISGGTVDSCTAPNGFGGGILFDGSNPNVSMKNGTIQNCSAKCGGAIGISFNADKELVFSDGLIQNCTATNGGAIGYEQKGSFNMQGGAIKNCATSNMGLGGAAYVDTIGTFKMNGGEISGNTAYQGGAIYAKTDIVMNGGIIKENKVNNLGGALRLEENADFTMNDGQIINNQVLNYYINNKGATVANTSYGAAIHGAGNNQIKLIKGTMSGHTSTGGDTYGDKNAIQVSGCGTTTQITIGAEFIMGENSIRFSGLSSRTIPVVKIVGNPITANNPLYIAVSTDIEKHIQIGCDSAAAATTMLPNVKSADNKAVFSVSGSNIVAAKK